VTALLDLLREPGLDEYPEWVRPYVAPLTRSIAAPPGSKLLPSRSGAVGRSTEHFGNEDNPTNWTPYGLFSVQDSPPGSPGMVAGFPPPRAQGSAEPGPLLSSGPQAGHPTRPAQAEAYQQNPQLWGLSGVASGWSKPYAPTPGRQPTTVFALGRWTPFSGGHAPLPGNPAPAQMVRPAL